MCAAGRSWNGLELVVFAISAAREVALTDAQILLAKQDLPKQSGCGFDPTSSSGSKIVLKMHLHRMRSDTRQPFEGYKNLIVAVAFS